MLFVVPEGTPHNHNHHLWDIFQKPAPDSVSKLHILSNLCTIRGPSGSLLPAKSFCVNASIFCQCGPRSAIDASGSTVTTMGDELNYPGNYRIEVSGWGLDNTFFVETTDLLWSQSGCKQVRLHRTLLEGTVVFVRLLAARSISRSVPVPYRVEDIKPMDTNGQCEMGLLQLRPRLKAPIERATASYAVEDLASQCEPRESSIPPELEEILQ